jgi:hypothetical protein
MSVILALENFQKGKKSDAKRYTIEVYYLKCVLENKLIKGLNGINIHTIQPHVHSKTIIMHIIAIPM